MNKEQLKQFVDYVWPDCPCGCGKQSFGWLGNRIFLFKLWRAFKNGQDPEELRQTVLRNILR